MSILVASIIISVVGGTLITIILMGLLLFNFVEYMDVALWILRCLFLVLVGVALIYIIPESLIKKIWSK